MGNAVPSRGCRDVDRLDASSSEDEIEDEGANARELKVVTVLKRDGTVLEFKKELSVSKLLKSFPGHFVCNSEELGSGAKARMLCPKARLALGKVYLLLPQQQKARRRSCSKINPVLALACPERLNSQQSSAAAAAASGYQRLGADDEPRSESIKLVMTKQQLAKMMADGSILMAAGNKEAAAQLMSVRANSPELSYSSMRLFNHPVVQSTNKSGSFRRNWSPALDSIIEVPSQ
ncbi:hypothetical protein MPTK1_8g18700 [Marchantia polymorpha subsp. ruderalis]|nr:hypothetical protein MARPO_0131s0033 [Marchantia polymorpha]BBN20388.1 hypothetical protein Mp_8g18700 [Marchantia polymorpha subsp. ruderalis]|eukprot:PTQ30039.1 hypothetical protein MARPO_0131s0033 [Marchantia polymorpha]